MHGETMELVELFELLSGDLAG